jgi:hypothetical protein
MKRATLALLVLVVAAAATTAAATTYTYDVDHYNRYVSHGSWWTHSSMTNATSAWLTWRVTFSTKACTDLSGAVTLALAARLAASASSCTTYGRDMSTEVPPRSSTALLQRSVLHYDYYLVRKIDRTTGRTVDSGYATRRDSFTDYAFFTH